MNKKKIAKKKREGFASAAGQGRDIEREGIPPR